MGALCSACYARRSPLGKERSLPGGPETFGLLPQTEAAGGAAAQASSNTSTALLAGSKSETFAMLGAAGGAGTTSSLKSENKRSLAAKWSGTLNRTNSGESRTLNFLLSYLNFPESKSYSEAKIVALFEKYKDSEEDSILSEGIEEFCIDLQLKPDEFKVLGEYGLWLKLFNNSFAAVLAWKFDAEQMCRFTRSEFLCGCRALRADSCRALQARLPEVGAALAADADTFRDLYRFTYKVPTVLTSPFLH